MSNQHQGGCHCGAVRYQVEVDLGKPVIQCNCSICMRTGTFLTFVPADKFKLEKGEAQLTDYQFNHKVIHHLFCNTCGIRSFARGTDRQGNPTVAINARCLDDVDYEQFNIQSYNGKKS